MQLISQFNHKQQKRVAAFMIALSGILYGFLGYLGTRILQDHISLSSMLFWRFFIAACWMFIFIVFSKVRHVTLYKPALLKLLLTGVILYSASSLFYFMASKEIGVGLAMVIFFSFPIFVAIFSFLSGNLGLNRLMLTSLAGVMLGLAMMKGHGIDSLNSIGLSLSLFAAFLYAVYVYINREITNHITTERFTLFICAGNAVLFFIWAVVAGKFAAPVLLRSWVWIFLLGIFATAIPIQLFLRGMQFISPMKASILSVLEPAVTLLVGVALLHESVTMMQMAGVIIIIVSAVLVQVEPTSQQCVQADT